MTFRFILRVGVSSPPWMLRSTGRMQNFCSWRTKKGQTLPYPPSPSNLVIKMLVEEDFKLLHVEPMHLNVTFSLFYFSSVYWSSNVQISYCAPNYKQRYLRLSWADMWLQPFKSFRQYQPIQASKWADCFFFFDIMADLVIGCHRRRSGIASVTLCIMWHFS